MGLLADVFSWGNKQKRRVRGLLDNPEDEARVFAHRSAETTRDFLLDPMNFIGGGLAGTFIGKGAKTWNKAMHGKALQMENAGMDPRAIWKETGNWKGPDGHWRQEIPDDAATFSTKGRLNFADEYLQKRGFGGKLGSPSLPENIQSDALRYADNKLNAHEVADSLSHDALFGAYPITSHYPLKLKNSSGLRGSFDDKTKTITISDPLMNDLGASRKSTAIHELQHGVQDIEGWARGGSPDNAPIINEEALSAIRAQKKSLGIDPYAIMNRKSAGYRVSDDEIAALNKYQELNAVEDAILSNKLDPYEAYHRLAGEAEARATQARMPMNAAQRREVFPADSYDVPLDQLIIRGLLE